MQCPPTPGPGLQYVHPRMPVGQFDHLPDVNVVAVADHRQLIGKGNVDVAVGVLGELDHLRGARVGFETLRLEKNPVDL